MALSHKERENINILIKINLCFSWDLYKMEGSCIPLQYNLCTKKEQRGILWRLWVMSASESFTDYALGWVWFGLVFLRRGHSKKLLNIGGGGL